MTTPSASAALPEAQPASLPPIAYVLRFPEPHTHYVEVEATVPTGGRDAIELTMAVWTPGSYLVREYSRHVEDVRAEANGASLAVEKTAKNRWRVNAGGAPSVTVSYRVYGREMSVRTNWVEAGFALINGAPTFLTLADEAAPRPHEVRVELPDGWRTAISALPAASSAPNHFVAKDFDTLVDSPLVAGSPSVHEFTAAGRPHVLVNVGDDSMWDAERSVADLTKLVEAHAAFWKDVPYDRYVIFNVITEASGGLEHRDSTVLMTSRWKTRTRRAYVDWLSLVSHELFHVWNGKRLRPVELGPFEYGQENYTRSLWAVEGLTSYYGDLLAARAGVIGEDEYLGELASMIADLQATPGRLAQPVTEASFDAWIRYYRQDENTPNTTVSYYTKGAIVGLLLDLEIRRVSNDAVSLDDVMRAAYRQYSGATGFTSAQFRALVSEVAGHDLSGWLRNALDTTSELEYAPLAHVGLRVNIESTGAGGRAWLGLQLSRPATVKDEGGRLVVTQVRRGTPAWKAGVNVDDEIIALGGYRVRPDQWEARLAAFQPGETVPLLVARRERLLTLDVTLGAEPSRARLEPDPNASDDARRRRSGWLGNGS